MESAWVVLVAAGAVAALLLLALRRILPSPALSVLGLTAIGAGFATEPSALTLFPAMVPMIEKLVLLPIGSSVGRWIDLVATLPGIMLGWPASFVSGHLDHASPLASSLVYAAYWALLQMLAVTAVASIAPPLPLPKPMAKLRDALSGPWPTGIRAAIATIVAALAMAALPRIMVLYLGAGPLPAAGILLGFGLLPFGSIVLLRLLLPGAVSQGAWTIVIGIAPVLLWQMVLMRFPPMTWLPGGWAYRGYYLVGLAVLSALLLMSGPRLQLRSNRIAWIAWISAFAIVVLPGIGWLILHRWPHV